MAVDSPFRTRADFADRTVLVCGIGMAGVSAVRALLTLGARVLVTADQPGAAATLPPTAEYLGALTQVPAGVAAVVSSPGLPPGHPVLRDAAATAVPVFGELEFAWRIRGDRAAQWLMITGTNGKTTAVKMLESMLRAAGLSAVAVGNVGVSIIDAVLADSELADSYDVLAVEASSFQLHFADTIAPRAGALLNLAEDHLDWHGSMTAYAGAKTKVWTGDWAIGNADDLAVAQLLTAAPAPSTTSFTLAEPRPGQYGVRDGQLVDGTGQVLVPAAQVRPAGPHNVANALAAAALASRRLGDRALALAIEKEGTIDGSAQAKHATLLETIADSRPSTS